MTLTLCSSNQTQRIAITSEQFKMLRSLSATSYDIALIANQCGIERKVLIEYAADLKRSANEFRELDTACDYTDQR